MNTTYGSSVASLFACAARTAKPMDDTQCPKCGSTDTKPVDNEFGTLECTECGTVFVRSAPAMAER